MRACPLSPANTMDQCREDSTEEDGHRRRSSDRRDSSISGKLTENPIDNIALIILSRYNYNDFL